MMVKRRGSTSGGNVMMKREACHGRDGVETMKRLGFVAALALCSFAVGCVVYTRGTTAFLRGDSASQVVAWVPVDPVNPSGKIRRVRLPGGTELLVSHDPMDAAEVNGGKRSLEHLSLVRATVIGGEHHGMEVLVSRNDLSLRPTIGATVPDEFVFISVSLTLIVCAVWHVCGPWLEEQMRRRRARNLQLAAEGRLRTPRSCPDEIPFVRDDGRWLAWLQRQTARLKADRYKRRCA